MTITIRDIEHVPEIVQFVQDHVEQFLAFNQKPHRRTIRYGHNDVTFNWTFSPKIEEPNVGK